MSEEENKNDETPEATGSDNVDINADNKIASNQNDPEDSDHASNSSSSSSAALVAKSISGKDVNIDALLKVPVSLAIEVGRTRLSLNDLLGTREGSVIELDRHLDEPLDILVNGALIAHGVVVLANEKFGLQITDIISLEERARSL